MVYKLGIVLLLILIVRLGLYYQKESKHNNGQFMDLETTLFTQPQILGNYQKLTVSSDGRDKIFVTTTRFPRFNYGDYVRISGKIKIIQVQPTPNTSTLKGGLISNEKTILTMSFPKIEAVKISRNDPWYLLLSLASVIRQKVTVLFNVALPPASAGLLLGIVFGIKSSFSPEFTENLRTAGVMHVIAASGMNVTMIGGFLSSIFALLFRRQLALVFSIFGIIFYAFIAGLEPSILRATIMGIFGFSALILGRQYLGIYGLGLSAFLMLFISPQLLFDVGFQLSFLATFGLLYIRPIFQGKSLIGEDVATTLAAQLATLPVLLGNFGAYSLLSVIVNGLVLWTVPILMVLGGIGAVVGLVFAPLGKLFLYLSLPLLLYFQNVVSIFGNLGLKFQFQEFPLALSIGYYLVLASILMFIYSKKSKASL